MKTRMAMTLALMTAASCGRTSERPAVRTNALEAEAVAERAEKPGGFVGELAVVWIAADPIVSDNPDDQDLDGFPTEADPDDTDPFLYPGAREDPCDGIDQDDDGLDPCWPDLDQDGFRADLDCDDGDPGIRPLVLDTECNGVDENCNGHDECDTDGAGVQDHVDPDPEDPGVGPMRADQGHASAEDGL